MKNLLIEIGLFLFSGLAVAVTGIGWSVCLAACAGIYAWQWLQNKLGCKETME